jgi:hypothetical protein
VQQDRRSLRGSDELLDLLLDALAALLAGELLGAVLLALGLPVVGGLALAGLGVGKVGVLADLGVSLLVDFLETIGYENISNCSETLDAVLRLPSIPSSMYFWNCDL